MTSSSAIDPPPSAAIISTRSVSQILADSLSLGPSPQSPPPSSSSSNRRRPSGPSRDIPSAKQIALSARYNRRVSCDDANATGVAESRRVSLNDSLPSRSLARRYHSSRQQQPQHQHRRRSSAMSSTSTGKPTTKRVSFHEDLSLDDDDDDEEDVKNKDDEEYAAFIATAAAAEAKNSKSRLQQARRRVSYNDASEYEYASNSSLHNSEEETRVPSSIMKTARRRHTMGDALDYHDDTDDDDDDDDEQDKDSNKIARRRVSFSSDLVSSVHEVPQITKLQKREMFWRKREIKQFRIDSWLEKSLIISDQQNQASSSQNMPLPTTTSTLGHTRTSSRPSTDFTPSNTAIVPSRKSSLPMRRTSNPKQTRRMSSIDSSSSTTSFPRRGSNSTSHDIRITSDEHRSSASTDALKDALRESMSKRIRGAVQRVDQTCQMASLPSPPRIDDKTINETPHSLREEQSSAITSQASSSEVPVSFLSDSFFTGSDMTAAALAAESSRSSCQSSSPEEKLGDWTDHLRVCARSRIDAAIARQQANASGGRSRSREGSTSSSVASSYSSPHDGRAGSPRMKRRSSIEALAA